MEICFNIPYTDPASETNINELIKNPESISNRVYSNKCKTYFETLFPGYNAFMTNSCTSAMQLIALTLDISQGDEVILPSYNFVGVANAFANFGAELKFADILPETMNVDPKSIESLITKKTKAVVVMHYAGVACELEEIRQICDEHNLYLIEDNAQGICAKYDDNKLLGSIGDFSCISFDSLKNISCGEGGLLLCKKQYFKKVVNSFENGTNKYDFYQKKVDAYEWVCKGLKFALSEYNAAILHPLLLKSEEISQNRMNKWKKYYTLLSSIEKLKHLLPISIKNQYHNAHIFYLKCNDKKERDELLHYLNNEGIAASFHYTPLHSSAYGKKMNFTIDKDRYTSVESNRLLRLPLYNELSDDKIEYIVNKVEEFYS